MKSSQLQSLLMRNANRIHVMEKYISHVKVHIKYYRNSASMYYVYKNVVKYKKEIKALAALQVALKQELKDVYAYEYGANYVNDNGAYDWFGF